MKEQYIYIIYLVFIYSFYKLLVTRCYFHILRIQFFKGVYDIAVDNEDNCKRRKKVLNKIVKSQRRQLTFELLSYEVRKDQKSSLKRPITNDEMDIEIINVKIGSLLKRLLQDIMQNTLDKLTIQKLMKIKYTLS